MDPKEAVIKAMELHDAAGRELLVGRLHRAKAYILEAVRTLREVAEANRDRMYGFDEFVRQLDELYQELYVVDPRSATATELDRYRWRLHRLIEDFAFKTLDVIDGVVEIPVDGWIDENARIFAREFVKAKKRLEEVGMVSPEDRGLRAYVIGGVAYVKVGSSPDHAASLRYSAEHGSYVLRYYDRDRPILKTFKKLVPGRVVGEGEDYVEIAVDSRDLQKAARALALMASEDIRRDILGEFYGVHPADKSTVAAIVFAKPYRRFIETGKPPRFDVVAAYLLLDDVYGLLDDYFEAKKALKDFAAGKRNWEDAKRSVLLLLDRLMPVYRSFNFDTQGLEKLRYEIKHDYVYEDLMAEMPESEARRAVAKRYISTLNELMRSVMNKVVKTGAILEMKKGDVFFKVYAEPLDIQIPGFERYLERRKKKKQMATV
jgi:hypothetical protein